MISIRTEPASAGVLVAAGLGWRAERAINAYSAITDRPGPYKVMVSEPSRQARLTFR